MYLPLLMSLDGTLWGRSSSITINTTNSINLIHTLQHMLQRTTHHTDFRGETNRMQQLQNRGCQSSRVLT
jgi:hypothetical protein